MGGPLAVLCAFVAVATASGAVAVGHAQTAPPVPPGIAVSGDARAELRAQYEAAVERFWASRAFGDAVTFIGGWSRDMLDEAVTAARRNDPAFAYAAAAFHLEVALGIAPDAPDEALEHIRWGERLLDALPPPEKDHAVGEFVGRWYATAVSIFMAQTDAARAKTLANRATGKASGSSRVQFVVGRIEDVAALALNVDSVRPEARPRLQLERRSRLAVVERIYRRALSIDPGYTKAQVHLGRVLLELDRRDDGRRVLEPIAGGPDHGAGDRYLASLFLAADYERAGDVDRARTMLDGLEAIAPGRQTGWVALAQLEQRSGRVERAREIVAAHLGPASELDEWWAYRLGGLQIEDLVWLRDQIGR